MTHRHITCALATGFLLAATSARAEPPPADATVDRYEWDFDADDLHSVGANPYGEWLAVHKKAPRVLLIRPRTSFVFELLESIGRL